MKPFSTNYLYCLRSRYSKQYTLRLNLIELSFAGFCEPDGSASCSFCAKQNEAVRDQVDLFTVRW